MRFREHRQTLAQDIRYAARGLVRRPAFTAVAVLTIGIGVGAPTTIFSTVNALLLRPLPFSRPDQLMKVSLSSPAVGSRVANVDAVLPLVAGEAAPRIAGCVGGRWRARAGRGSGALESRCRHGCISVCPGRAGAMEEMLGTGPAPMK